MLIFSPIKMLNMNSHYFRFVEISATSCKSEAGFKNCPIPCQLQCLSPVGTLNNNVRQV